VKKDELYLLNFKFLLCCLSIVFFCCKGNCQSGRKDWLSKLNKEIQESSQYDAERLARLDILKKRIGNSTGQDLFDQYLRLYNEYAVFNFDSAYFYALKLQETASSMNDTSLMQYAKIKLGFTLLSSGMYKEVHESLRDLKATGMKDSVRGEYYILKARYYFDLADYNHDNIFSPSYNAAAGRYLDSSLMVFPKNSFQFLYYRGLKNIRAGEIGMASAYFQKLINDSALSLHEQAIVTSTFSDIYIRRGLRDSAIILLAKAAVADIQSSTKETSAILNLATLLFKEGDLEHASTFIQKAANDAKIYGARQRILQLSTIMPLIEAKKLGNVVKENSNITRYATSITFLLVALLIFGIIIIRQIRKMKVQQKEISDQNISLHHMIEEKEILVKEIHHRVKNNLQIITSLLESQSAYLKNESLDAIQDTQHRIFAMSLIHQKLYQPEKNEIKINITAYLHELVNYLCESFKTTPRIKFQMDLEPVELDISLAMPIGMILNEAITNSVKYAFPGQREGIINISIKKAGENRLLFSVADNGIGLPDALDINKVNSLGMKLMRGLSDDIAARFSIKNKQGTEITIEFKTDKSLQSQRNISGN
jgi:two-component sensor histidine kinase